MKSINPNGNAGNAILRPKINLLAIMKLYSAEISKSFINVFGFSLLKRLKNHHYYYLDDIK